MEITNNTVNGQFEVRQGDHLAYMTYRERDGVLYMMHTEVPQALGGQGIGSALVEHALSYAEARGMAYRPYCVFAKGYLEKHPR
ncbi:MAG: GNAT family N-acetyltransferase [Bacteroidota bacterium]